MQAEACSNADCLVKDSKESKCTTQPNKLREFETGANRNSDKGKLEYRRFFSALAQKRRAEYMDKHRKLEDGTLREPDNWKRGIPSDVCADSLERHMQDIKLYFEGYEFAMTEDIEDALCAVMFNCESILLTILQSERMDKSRK